jgi:putative FMN-dependent luciferase-like monooxygenase
LTSPLARWGFFTRVLDDAPPAERYRLATEQIVHAERLGFGSAWVAQHHFHADEGGLPSPFVFLAQAAARTTRIRLGTGIVTLPLEAPVRVAEDAAVFDLISGGRLELGVGTGGNPSAFKTFGLDSDARTAIFEANLAILRDGLSGRPLAGGDVLYPARPELDRRIWQATFSTFGGIRAGKAGDGLLLSRTQPRSPEAPDASLSDIQDPIIDAYLAALPPACAPRILGSRSVFVADTHEEAWRLAEIGLTRAAARLATLGRARTDLSVEGLVRAGDVHLGTPEEVVESLLSDRTLARVTDIAVQVHSIDPPHPAILRSIELVATDVAPAYERAIAAEAPTLRRAG